MTHTANFRDVIRAELLKTGGKADTVTLARRLDLDAHGLAWELEQADDAFVNVNGEWMPNTVWAAVLAYAEPHDDLSLPPATVRDDVARIVEQHADTGSVRFTPRGGHGTGDFEVFDFAGDQIALVTVYTDGRVEALPVVPGEIVDVVAVPGTPAEWHAYIRAAATFVDAQDRMEEARAAGVDFREMLAAHDIPEPSAAACEDLVAGVAPPALETRTNVTVYYRGRATTARRVEPLENGFWRADLAGSGLSVLYDTDPTDDPTAVQATVMTYGNGWPFCEMLDGYAAEAQAEADAEQAEREAREDRAADHAPGPQLNWDRVSS